MSDLDLGAVAEHQERFEEELAAGFSNDHLHLILLPTEQCNFRCTYCYEDFTVGHMTPATIQGVKRLIDRRLHDLGSLAISWFGGEPLLARGIVEDISEHIVRAAGSKPEFTYEGDMTTNGYLLDAAAVERLAGLGIRLFQVSLDGPEPLHDRTRVRTTGAGSFRQIWRNLLAVRDGTEPVNILLRIHLTPGNLPAMPEFLVHVRETFLGDERFQVLLKPVERLGGPHDDSLEIVPQESRPRILAELEAILLDKAADHHRLYDAPQVCYAARANSLVIRANGLVGKCTVALTDPANAVGRLRPDGSLQIDNDRFRPWLRGWESGDWSVVGCPYASFERSKSTLPLVSGPTRPSN